ncbi:DUF2971 domain-containing protein [Serratia proteamaculans]|uniref:DUF2971 domain-containing protein n=1 Tax=Serratia proteamaculans TaxID=28151 RepID=UPI0039B0A5AF
MDLIYRLRSIAALLGEYNELENQSIYFAPPEELNDPMEGFKRIFWQGDAIIWLNLFKHYFFCLHETYFLSNLADESIEFNASLIPIFYQKNQFPTKMYEKLFEDAWQKTCEEACLKEFSDMLAEKNRKVEPNELLLYLKDLHVISLFILKGAYIENGLTTDFDSPPPLVKSMIKKIIETKAYNEINDDDELNLNMLFDVFLKTRYQVDLISRYNLSENVFSDNETKRPFLIFDFPQEYMVRIEELLYPKWYTACFMDTYNNSSAWGHYASNHTGACLIFKVDNLDNKNTINLNKITSYSGSKNSGMQKNRSFSPMGIDKVNYNQQAPEIDFFRSIGWLPIPTLLKHWYSDRNKNISTCGQHLISDGVNESWRDIYWENFMKDKTIKTNDWSYEREYRIVLHSLISDLSEKEDRVLNYDFSSLHGIIFGIKTKESEKIKIMKVIEKKCIESKRNDFKFYQAYYCKKLGNVQKRELSLLKFETKNNHSA